MTYDAPVVQDLGSLAEMTQASGFFGTEDGATKLLPTHHEPELPSLGITP